jgi:hypothetical protein
VEPTTTQARITPLFRLALLGKGALLAGIAAVFARLAIQLAFGASLWPLRIAAGLVLAPLALFLLWAAGLGLVDALLGRAERASGALALQSRRAGYSLQLPDGRFVEFILWNPWQPVVPGRRYTVVFGRRSMVLVRPPEPEP